MLKIGTGKMIEKTKTEDISKTSTHTLIIYLRFLLKESPLMNSFVYRRELEVLETITMSEMLDELEYRALKKEIENEQIHRNSW